MNARPFPCRRARLSRLSATLLTLAGTLLTLAPAATAEPSTITVFAAASLKNALDDAAAHYKTATGTQAIVSYAASSALAKQIEQGAPADIFIAADRDWMDYLAKADLIRTDTRADLLSNRLVLIAPASNTLSLEIKNGFALAAALGDGRLAVADVSAVPAGRYAKAALESLGVWTTVADRTAPAENVRVALMFVARGEAPLGIVYATDARAEPKVRVVGVFPESSHPPIVYPIAVTATAKNPDAAAAFVGYLRSADGQAVFAGHGFSSPVPASQ
ncbi:MAG: molybdate ABC transporter substrate-binding protein [Hyphomicrobium sp.]